jgi:hypothetical protein
MSTEIKTNSASLRVAWNKGRLVGQKRPLRPKEVWAIRVRLQIKHRKRDLAMFNLAIDSKLRDCDLVSVRVDDIASGGHVRDRATTALPCWRSQSIASATLSPARAPDTSVADSAKIQPSERW